MKFSAAAAFLALASVALARSGPSRLVERDVVDVTCAAAFDLLRPLLSQDGLIAQANQVNPAVGSALEGALARVNGLLFDGTGITTDVVDQATNAVNGLAATVSDHLRDTPASGPVAVALNTVNIQVSDIQAKLANLKDCLVGSESN